MSPPSPTHTQVQCEPPARDAVLPHHHAASEARHLPSPPLPLPGAQSLALPTATLSYYCATLGESSFSSLKSSLTSIQLGHQSFFRRKIFTRCRIGKASHFGHYSLSIHLSECLLYTIFFIFSSLPPLLGSKQLNSKDYMLILTTVHWTEMSGIYKHF